MNTDFDGMERTEIKQFIQTFCSTFASERIKSNYEEAWPCQFFLNMGHSQPLFIYFRFSVFLLDNW